MKEKRKRGSFHSRSSRVVWRQTGNKAELSDTFRPTQKDFLLRQEKKQNIFNERKKVWLLLLDILLSHIYEECRTIRFSMPTLDWKQNPFFFLCGMWNFTELSLRLLSGMSVHFWPFWYQCYNPQMSRDSVSLVCRIFIVFVNYTQTGCFRYLCLTDPVLPRLFYKQPCDSFIDSLIKSSFSSRSW